MRVKKNMIHELKCIKDISCADLPFNEIDGLLFSMLSYMPFGLIMNEDIENKELSASEVKAKLRDFKSPSNAKRKLSDIELLTLVLDSKRYKDLVFSNYLKHNDEETEQQYASITFLIDDIIYIAFCGTDATTLGWKEDLNFMLFEDLPSELEGASYTKKMLELYNNKKWIIGGHSKGGSIALYSAVKNTKYLDRLLKVYSFDGPGFNQEFYQSDSYKLISKYVEKYVPKSSIIGMLFDNVDNYKIIKCYSKSIAQHDPYNWMVDYHQFIYEKNLNSRTLKLDSGINEWIYSLNKDEKKLFIDTFYEIIKKIDIVEFKDIKYNPVLNSLIKVKRK